MIGSMLKVILCKNAFVSKYIFKWNTNIYIYSPHLHHQL